MQDDQTTQTASKITVQDVLSDDFKPRTVPVHESHTKTYFSEKQLRDDPEAREIEAMLTHGKPPSVDVDSSLLKQAFYSVDEYGNKIPSVHAIDVFNEYGVNEQGMTVSQVLQSEKEAKSDFDDYSARYVYLLTEIQRVKTLQKELDIEFKDKGCDTSKFKNTVKRAQKYKTQTDEDRWVDGVLLNWALTSTKLADALNLLEIAKQETKDVGKDKEARNEIMMRNVEDRYKKRYEQDKVERRGALDNEIERQAKFASLGVDSAEDQFIRLEESKKIREERRYHGLPDLAMHSNELQPANPAQHGDVFNEEFHKRREEFERKKREERLFDPKAREKEWQLDYTPTDVPDFVDFEELAKHGIHQARRMQDCAFMVIKAREQGIPLPDEKWVQKFKDMEDQQLRQLIMQGANVEDYLDNKIICDQVYLPADDPRRDDWMTPDMIIARYNRLQRIGKIKGDYIEFDVNKALGQVRLVPIELRMPYDSKDWYMQYNKIRDLLKEHGAIEELD